jgi:hypothetical protein
MNRNIEKSLVATALALSLAACGGGDGNSNSSSNDSNGSSPEPSETLPGGSLAQEFADSTLACTSVDAVVPGFPAPLVTPDPDQDLLRPPPPSVGSDIPVTYFGPAPSSVNPNLIGPLTLLTAGTLDLEADPATITLPLYEGRLSRPGAANDGATLWYVVTDTSDEQNAAALGLNFSAKLNFSDAPPAMATMLMQTAVRRAFYDNAGILVFEQGSVDFSPERMVSPGSTDVSGTSNLLTTLSFQPGSVGSESASSDGFYSPLVEIVNAGGHVYNAPMVSFGTQASDLAPYCDGIPAAEETAARAIVHDKVVRICPGQSGEPGTVTLALTSGFSFGRPVLYLSTDASADIAASLEAAIHVPALANIAVGRDDSLFSAVERIFGFTNGPTNDFAEVNPQRQGFNSAIVGQGGPLNVLGGIPTVATDYSPLWDLNLGEWTQEAIDAGYRSRMTEEFAILGMVTRGFVTGPGGAPYGSTGIIINCPIVHRFL